MEKLYKNYLEKLFRTESFWIEALKDSKYGDVLSIYQPYYKSVINMIDDLKVAFNIVDEIKDLHYKTEHWEELYEENAKRMTETIREDKTLRGRDPYSFYPGSGYFELKLVEKMFELSESGWIGFMTHFDFLSKSLALDRLDYPDWNLNYFYYGQVVGVDEYSKELSPHIKDKMLINGRWLTQRNRMIDDHILFFKTILPVNQKIETTCYSLDLGTIIAFLGLSPKAIEFICKLKSIDMSDFEEFEENYTGTFIEQDMLELKKLIPTCVHSTKIRNKLF